MGKTVSRLKRLSLTEIRAGGDLAFHVSFPPFLPGKIAALLVRQQNTSCKDLELAAFGDSTNVMQPLLLADLAPESPIAGENVEPLSG